MRSTRRGRSSSRLATRSVLASLPISRSTSDPMVSEGGLPTEESSRTGDRSWTEGHMVTLLLGSERGPEGSDDRVEEVEERLKAGASVDTVGVDGSI